ncbi:uncharacterized protein LOC119986160 [Tripterygium wilfordii]|uniref:uncharacterized protein LOC119986160 n=1 Tax=Tripterygium wilfordii TaxID=458696 RepID=UPI0018F8537B|nr:uncharacterized protein LOC119986160 [Tripterygium wilfordii]
MAIYEGINLAASLGLSNLLVESDSLIVINILSESMSCPWNLIYLKRAIAKNCMSLDINFKHVYRELNGVADFVASKASNSKVSTVYDNFCNLPPTVKGLLQMDRLGIPAFRIRK